jgi:hypothetical protein
MEARAAAEEEARRAAEALAAERDADRAAEQVVEPDASEIAAESAPADEAPAERVDPSEPTEFAHAEAALPPVDGGSEDSILPRLQNSEDS